MGTLYASSVIYSKSKPVQKVKIMPYFSGKSPYIFAHRGGMKLAPEHTMAAFNKSAQLEVDGFEIDIRLTKDEHIVVLHDAAVDRVSNGSGLVYDHTLEELRQLDFGYSYRDANGEYPFRGERIVTLEELINAFPNLRINIDIKDHPDSKAGQLVPSLLYRLIKDLQCESRVLVTSFYDAQVRRFKNYTDSVAIGASKEEVTKAYLAYVSGHGNRYTSDVSTFQIPLTFGSIRLDSEKFIEYLQQRNIAVGYWVVNSIDLMDDLLIKGAHTIVTDRPDLSYHLINEKYKK